MSKIIADTKDMSRFDWLETRSKYLGGSDASIVLGLNKWKTPFELYLEKTGQTEIQEIDNEAIHFGNVLEDVVAKEFERRSGKKVRRNHKMMQHEEHEFMMANIDREVVGEKAVLECKTTSAYNAKEWAGDEIPESYIVQVQHYLAVTGHEKAYIACLIGGQKFVWKEIERDEELIELIINAEKMFWEFHVVGNNPPALDGSSAAEKFLKDRYSRGQSEIVVDLDTEKDASITELINLKNTIKKLEKQAKEIENKVKFEMKEAQTGLSRNYKVTWNTVESKKVDTKKLKEENPDIYESYAKVSTSRRFVVKELGES